MARSSTERPLPGTRSIAAIGCRRISPAITCTAKSSARIVRRLRPVKTEGLTRLQNVYPRSEFIRSLDPLFRPVDMATAPDGTIYIADMYRGVIEGAEWAREGTYLREKIKQYQLDKVTKRGRIWRLTYDGIARDRTTPRMLNETSAQLVARLSHPNGWWRDTAQQLLVLRQDRSVVSALKRLCGRRRIRSPASTRCGRSKDWRRSGRQSCANCSEMPAPTCGFRRFAPARVCTRPETSRSPASTARFRPIQTSTS